MLAGVLKGGLGQYLDEAKVSRRFLPLQLSPTQREFLQLTDYLNPMSADGTYSAHEASSGAYATTFRNAQGEVVKITTDPDDVYALLVLNGKTKRTPKVRDAVQILDQVTRMYAVIVEYIHDYDPDVIEQRDVMRPVQRVALEVNEQAVFDNAVNPYFATPSYVFDTNANTKTTCTEVFRARHLLTPDACKQLVIELGDLQTRMGREGLVLRDIHGGNLGWRDPKDLTSWVIRDLGTSGVRSGTPPVRALSGLPPHQLDRIFRRLS